MKKNRMQVMPFNGGWQNDVPANQVPDGAFPFIKNAYSFRNRVVKRWGAWVMYTGVADEYQQLYTRLRMQIGTTDGNGDLGPVNLPGASGFRLNYNGQMFSIQNNANANEYEIITITDLLPISTYKSSLGSVAGAAVIYDADSDPAVFEITGTYPNSVVYWYPSLPVMGMITDDTGLINDQPTIFFDPQFSYANTNPVNGFDRYDLAAATPTVWTGGNANLFTGTTWRGVLASANYPYVTNGVDPIRYYDATVPAWVDLEPAIDATTDLEAALIVLPWKDRLWAFNTTEGGVNYVNRIRYSQNGDPLGTDAWRQDMAGRGGFIDASTSERITGIAPLRDRIIIYFERSVWSLAYTGNQIIPGVLIKINDNQGSYSPTSVISGADFAYGIGFNGAHASNGATVFRIDQKIPNEVWGIRNTNPAPTRICSIRDWFRQLMYWSTPISTFTSGVNGTYNQQVLVYNYVEKTWSVFDDSITAFGYFNDQDDLTWGAATMLWGDADFPWGGSIDLTANTQQVVCGNQEGFVFKVNHRLSRNCMSLSINNIDPATPTDTNLITIKAVNHNLEAGEYVFLKNIIEDPDAAAGNMQELNDKIFEVFETTAANNFVINVNGRVSNNTITGSYAGAGTIERVSRLDIQTKQYNIYASEGKNALVSQVDFLVSRQAIGSITVDFLASSSPESLLGGAVVTGSLYGTGMLELTPYALAPLEQTQERLWHPVYLQAKGETIQVRMYYFDDQMLDPDSAFADFNLHGMILYSTPAGRLR